MVSQLSSTRIAIKWAFVQMILCIALTAIWYYLNVNITLVKFVSFIAFIIFLLFTQIEYKRQLGGFLTFGEGFLAGFKFSIVSMFLTALFIYLYWTLFDPKSFSALIDLTNQQNTLQNSTVEQISMAQKYLTPGFFSVLIFLIGLIIGAIISLIFAAIVKKDKPAFLSHATYSDPAV